MSNVDGLSKYAETFAHIISRKVKGRPRYYEGDRANRIHWIKPILLGHPCNDIKYYKWMDDDGVCKEHFWLRHKKFMVVLRDVGQDAQIVTSFCVDDDKELVYYERYKNYIEGRGTC